AALVWREGPGRRAAAVFPGVRRGWLAWLAAAACDITVTPAADSAVARQQARTASAHLAAAAAGRGRAAVRTTASRQARGPPRLHRLRSVGLFRAAGSVSIAW